MSSSAAERLVAVLEALAETLEQLARHAGDAVSQGPMVPRLRRPAMGAQYAAGMPEFGRAEVLGSNPLDAPEIGEMAAALRDAIREVQAGKGDGGWIESLGRRAGRHVDDALVEAVELAVRRHFGQPPG